jgi:hypothetical protein
MISETGKKAPPARKVARRPDRRRAIRPIDGV